MFEEIFMKGNRKIEKQCVCGSYVIKNAVDL